MTAHLQLPHIRSRVEPDLLNMAQSTKSAEAAQAAAAAVAQQGDNIAHALAGAGGGLLSMTLTFVLPSNALTDTANWLLPAIP